MKAPFPYFGGKSSIANIVWELLGQPNHYIEPFFGSGAVLLNRLNYDAHKHVETVCDMDGYLANVWRSLKFSPDETAKWCDWPVNHADLSARKKGIIKNKDRLLENLIKDDMWHDPKIAGYWIWAASCWIGSGLTMIGQIPHIGDGGQGIHAIGQIPHISNGGQGIHTIGQIPHVGNGGEGIHAIGKIPHVGGGGVNPNIYGWFNELSERLRYVRVVCGDWTRVCGGNWQDGMGDVGIFFDPPYGFEDRCKTIYEEESLTVAGDVRKWCIERGKIKTYKIVLAGYFEEHQELLKHSWKHYKWKANGGYANIGESQGKKNANRETLFYSPFCNEIELNLL